MPNVLTAEVTVDAVLQQAIAFHSARNLGEAERLYHAILVKDRGHVQALHNLGVLTLQKRNATAALPYLQAALESRPDHPQFWLSYTSGLMQAGFVGDANLILTEAKRQGLQGDAFETLAQRLQTQAQAIDRKLWLPDLAGEDYLRVLGRLHEALTPATYLEIGVQTGLTLGLSRCASIGIDPEFQFQNMETVRRVVSKPSLHLYQMRSDDFFAQHDLATLFGAPIELAFLDGMHHCEFLLRDFINTERHCGPKSVIALHDCVPLELPMTERIPTAKAIDPLREGMWTGDVWRTALLLKRRRPDLKITVLDAAPTGLVLVSNLDPKNDTLAKQGELMVQEMMSWSLEQLTLPGYYQEMGIESESTLRQPEQIRARLRPAA